MQIQISFSPETVELIKAALCRLGVNLPSADVAPSAEEPKKGRGRPKKEEISEETENEETEKTEVEEKPKKGRGRPKKEETPPEDESEDSADDDDDESEDHDFEDEDDSAVVNAEQLKTLKHSLRLYSEKNGKEAAVKLLMKVAPSSAKVLQKDLPKLLKQLKV